MKREGPDENGTLRIIIDLGFKEYVDELYRRGDIRFETILIKAFRVLLKLGRADCLHPQ
jgi:hypothetical protein